MITVEGISVRRARLGVFVRPRVRLDVEPGTSQALVKIHSTFASRSAETARYRCWACSSAEPSKISSMTGRTGMSWYLVHFSLTLEIREAEVVLPGLWQYSLALIRSISGKTSEAGKHWRAAARSQRAPALRAAELDCNA